MSPEKLCLLRPSCRCRPSEFQHFCIGQQHVVADFGLPTPLNRVQGGTVYWQAVTEIQTAVCGQSETIYAAKLSLMGLKLCIRVSSDHVIHRLLSTMPAV